MKLRTKKIFVIDLKCYAIVHNNTFQMGCCAFAGYSASGVLLEDNQFTDLKWGAFVDGNGFTSSGNTRAAESG